MLANPDFNIFHDAPIPLVVCATSDEQQAAVDSCMLELRRTAARVPMAMR